jgi:hypothetical protein
MEGFTLRKTSRTLGSIFDPYEPDRSHIRAVMLVCFKKASHASALKGMTCPAMTNSRACHNAPIEGAPRSLSARCLAMSFAENRPRPRQPFSPPPACKDAAFWGPAPHCRERDSVRIRAAVSCALLLQAPVSEPQRSQLVTQACQLQRTFDRLTFNNRLYEQTADGLCYCSRI